METDLREEFAKIAHDAWTGWMVYMFSKSVKRDDGQVEIPASLVERWTRQMNTYYSDLPESEKESDRAEADKYIKAMKALTEIE